jgi:hypothetical protein
MPCDHEGRFRAPSELIEIAAKAASHNCLTASAYYRLALVKQLELDGFLETPIAEQMAVTLARSPDLIDRIRNRLTDRALRREDMANFRIARP